MEAGRELDALIAGQVFEKEITWFREADEPDEPTVLRDNAYIPIPHYSTDIKAAWLVVEKFNCVELMTVGSQWKCAFFFSTASNGVKQTTDYVYAETAPLAICLAALKALEN